MIFTFVLTWNDYIFARMLISPDELKTLPVGSPTSTMRALWIGG